MMPDIDIRNYADNYDEYVANEMRNALGHDEDDGLDFDEDADEITCRHCGTRAKEGFLCPECGRIAEKKQAKPGRVYIDIDAKIAAANTPEEKAAWESQRGEIERLNIDFCAGWHVGIYQQACGHWEILQHPVFKNYDGSRFLKENGQPYTAEDADRELREESTKRNCTRCVCKW